MNPTFFIGLLVRAILVGDVLNALGYRIRPYEVEPGATDRALEQCEEASSATRSRTARALLMALWQVPPHPERRREGRPHAPEAARSSIIGEFWAMTTEGDGNYQLQRFLEAEGAEVRHPARRPRGSSTCIWEVRYDTQAAR